MSGGHAAEEVEHENGYEFGQQSSMEPFIFGGEFVESQTIFEQFPHIRLFALGIWKRRYRDVQLNFNQVTCQNKID